MIAYLTAMMMATATPAPTDFLSGYWLSCAEGREVFEVWTQARGGVQVGHGATLEGGKVSFEQFRIAPYEDGLAYIAQPGGGDATAFRLAETGPNRAVFRNPAHDFPQTIVYERDGDRLNARIEGVMNGHVQVFGWTYERAELNARCPAS